MEINFSKHRMNDWNWIQEYKSIMDKEQYNNFFQKVYSTLFQIPQGKYFDISKNVTEKNRDIFIKICCLFILEQRKSVGDYWVFSDNYNLFIHKKHV